MKKFVVPPLGRKRRTQIHSVIPNACGLKAELRTELSFFQGVATRHEGYSEEAGDFSLPAHGQTKPPHFFIIDSAAGEFRLRRRWPAPLLK
jgi:hypothetical protein